MYTDFLIKFCFTSSQFDFELFIEVIMSILLTLAANADIDCNTDINYKRQCFRHIQTGNLSF